MTVFDNHPNFAKSLVAVAPSPATSGTSLTITTGDVAALALVPPFNAVVWPTGAQPTKANAEIVRVTANPTGDQFTITRTQEGSTNRTIVVGDQIMVSDTAKIFTDIENALNTISNAGFPGDGGAPNTSYVGVAKIDLGGPS